MAPSSGNDPENLKNQEPANWVLGSWTVEPSLHRLRHESGRAQSIEYRAMQVLQILHRSAGEVVPAEELYRQVWGRKIVSPHSLATVISDLRRVLGDNPHRPLYIQTIPKRGYRLLNPREIGATANRCQQDSPNRSTQALTRRWTFVAIAAAVVVVAVTIIVVLAAPIATHRTPAALDSGMTAQYMRARQLWHQREPQATQDALQLLADLLQRDPQFGPAHAAIADIYAHKTGEELGLPSTETFRLAQFHVDRAEALSPGLVETAVTRGVLAFFRDRDARAALASIDRALQQDPQFAYAWQTRAMVLSSLGRHAESLAAIARARALDPGSSSIRWDEVWFRYVARDFTGAQTLYDRLIKTEQPNVLFAALLAQARGDEVASMAWWLKRFADRGVRVPEPAALLEQVRQGQSTRAYTRLLSVVRSTPEYHDSATIFAILSALAGDGAQARSLLAAVEPTRRSWLSWWAALLPVLTGVSGDRPAS